MGYTVKKNDTLWDLAGSNNTTVNETLKLNPSITNPDKIYTGQVINLPTNLWQESGAASSSNNTNSGYEYTPFDPTKSSAYTIADLIAQAANKAVIDYNNRGFTWDQQGEYDTLRSKHNDFVNNGFSYDFNADALYQQYKDQYMKQGKMAMQDAMGQASALTGGYGNSYAATAGNQAYQASLENLNNVIPELYQMAYNMHQDKGQNMLNQLALLDSDRTFKYGAWVDKGNMLDKNRTFYQTEADNIYDRELEAHNTKESMLYQQSRDAVKDKQWKDSYLLDDRKVTLDEKKWDSVDEDGGYDENLNTNNPQPYTKEYYDGWTASMWVAYFKSIREQYGETEAQDELIKLLDADCIPEDMIYYATVGRDGVSYSGN